MQYSSNLAQRIAGLFAGYAQVEAVTLSGSSTSGVVTDDRSDIDLNVYTAAGTFPLAERRAVVERLGGAPRADFGLPYWGDGDLWLDADSGIEVDVVYPGMRATEEALERILVRCEPSGAYTTCEWHSVRTARILFDRSGWFARLQAGCDVPYPPALRRANNTYNLPILRDVIPSYRANLEKSLPRRDLVFINNEITWLLAAYFNVLFAINSVPHPGAKRMLEQAELLCPRRPPNLASDVSELLRLSAAADPALLPVLDRLVDGLERLV